MNPCKYEKEVMLAQVVCLYAFYAMKSGILIAWKESFFIIKSRRKGFIIVNILPGCLAIYIFSNCIGKKKSSSYQHVGKNKG